MKILVTGGAGYLGSVIVPALLREGHEVTVIDIFMYNQTPLLECCIDEGLTVVRGDACDKALIDQWVKWSDVIVPLACLTGAPLCDKEPEVARKVVVDALQLIIDVRDRDQMIIYPTTNSGYGVGEQGKFCTEETPLRPISLYGKLKVEAEDMVLKAGNGITLRLATAFGVSPRPRLDLLVNDFTYQAVFNGHIELFESHFKRNYIHLRDVAKAVMHMMANFDKLKGEAYNVGLSDANLNKWELCEEIQKQLPDFTFDENHDGKDPDQRDYIVSNEKIEATGFIPDVSLKMGIAELIKAFTILEKGRSREVQFSNI
ncbi:MAG: nucleoside-diphosphate-sugar epimerase [Lysobacterales bacterium]|jgi:nucleoside-diphosphate-sugar epimerase